MDNLLKNSLVGVYCGIFFSVIWFCLAYFQPETVLHGTILLWAVFGLVVFAIFWLLKPLKSKLYFALFVVVSWFICFGIGKVIGLSFFPALNIQTGLHFHPQSWLLYPFFGLLAISLFSFVPMLFFIVEEEPTVKLRWQRSGEILACIFSFGLILTLCYFLTSLI